MEDISKFDAEWILEEDPQVLIGEELDRYRKGLVPNDEAIRNAGDEEGGLVFKTMPTTTARRR
jgi:hypothetical protein